MLGRVKYDVAAMMSKVEVRTPEQLEREEAERRERLMRALQAQHAEVTTALALGAPPGAGAGAAAAGAASADVAGAADAPVAPFVRADRKVGRNEPCPCGSGRKYKQCHGMLDT